MGISNSKDGDELNDAIPSKGHRGGPDVNPSKAKRYNGDVPMSSAPMDDTSAASGEILSSGEINNENLDMDDIVPTVFRWEHGGRNAYITGTFNNWERQIPMHKSGNDFSYVHNLHRGKHAFKFVVDDEWRFAPDLPTVADVEGRINNFIDVTTFAPYSKCIHPFTHQPLLLLTEIILSTLISNDLYFTLSQCTAGDDNFFEKSKESKIPKDDFRQVMQ